MLARRQSTRNSHSSLGEMGKGAPTLEVGWQSLIDWTYPYHRIQPSSSLMFTQRSWKFTSTEKTAHECLQQLYHECLNIKLTRTSFSGWLDTLQYTQRTGYYSAPKRNERSSQEKTWKSLKCILLSERSQSEKATYCMIPTIWHSRNMDNVETVQGCHGLGRSK